MIKAGALVIVLLFCSSTWAAISARNFDDAEQERRYYSLTKELRCLVCQNQNLADSNAELAKDLRDKVYEMIKAGSSDAQIVDYMVDRYGEFVLYKPPVNLSTIFLWVGPFIILLVCLWGPDQDCAASEKWVSVAAGSGAT